MSAILVGKTKPRRRIVRNLGILALSGLLALCAVYALFLRWTRIEPPEEPENAEAQRPVEVHGQRVSVGANWMSRERGIWEYHLEGEPFDLGYAQSRLGNRLLMETEEYMFGEMHRYVPSQAAMFLIRAGVLFRYRNLTRFISDPYRMELYGLSRGYYDTHSDFLPIYHRVVFYHALHDITQTLERSPLLGCTAFAAAGPATLNGHLYLGRNFDFEGPPIFDKDKAVIFFKPKGKIPFASVAWTGMMGVVTGLNTQGIFVAVNAARTDDKGKEGVPVELLLREVLETARSLDEAIEIVRQRPVLVPDFYLIGDGKTNEAAVIERSPTRTEVRRSKDLLPLTNHALTPAFAADKENERLKTYMTSGARFARLQELLGQNRGIIDQYKALEILRDKRAPGGEPLGLGNRNAIDALIATHSVVADATNLVLWVGSGPHALGRYVAFDLRKELLGDERPAPQDLPEDPVRETAEYRSYQQAMLSLKSAGELAKLGDPDALDRAIEEVESAEALQPRMPEAQRLLGDLLRRRGDSKRGDAMQARRHYERFLEVHPPYLHEIEEVRVILQSL